MAQQLTDRIKSEITISLNKIIQNEDYDTLLNFLKDFYGFFVKSTDRDFVDKYLSSVE